MPLIITSNHSSIPITNHNKIIRNSLSITANPPQMPDVTVTAAMQGGGVLPYKAVFEWSATLAFESKNALYGGKRNTRHPDIARQIGPSPNWRIPFTVICGGRLTVEVVMRGGPRTERASRKWDIVGRNPLVANIRTFANSIGANRAAFRKLMKHESTLRQFKPGDNYWPLYSDDGKGGVGLCQLTNPPPTDEQTWNWQANVHAGWALYLVKEREARSYPGRVQGGADFHQLVAAWNRHTRPGLPALPVDVPAYTDDQLMRATLRRFNGGNEYRLRQVNGVLAVTVNASGTRGRAERESIPVAERTGPGDHNYVENVLREQDY